MGIYNGRSPMLIYFDCVVVESGMPVIARLLTGRVQGLPICCTPRTVFAVQLAPRTVIAVLGSVPYVV